MRGEKLTEIKALYNAYNAMQTGKAYFKKALDAAIENYLTLYVINYALDGNESKRIDGMYNDYYNYGRRLRRIREYSLKTEEVWKLQDEIIVPF